MGDNGHGASYYVKIWFLLLILLIISFVGPMLGNDIVTLITAFGIAVVKALIVAAYFMHLNIEKRWVHYMLYTMLIFVGLFWIGVASDVMNTSGTNWENVSSLEVIEKHREAYEAFENED